jgi:hypothetical protein
MPDDKPDLSELLAERNKTVTAALDKVLAMIADLQQDLKRKPKKEK